MNGAGTETVRAIWSKSQEKVKIYFDFDLLCDNFQSTIHMAIISCGETARCIRSVSKAFSELGKPTWSSLPFRNQQNIHKAIMQKLTWPRFNLNRWAAPDVLLHLRHTFTGRLVWVICGTNRDLVLDAALALQAVPALTASGESWGKGQDFWV